MTAGQLLILWIGLGVASVVLVAMLIGYGFSELFIRWLRGRKG
jgi:hypothetical protein